MQISPSFSALRFGEGTKPDRETKPSPDYLNAQKLIQSITDASNETEYSTLLEEVYTNDRELFKKTIKQAHGSSYIFLQRASFFLMEKAEASENK